MVRQLCRDIGRGVRELNDRLAGSPPQQQLEQLVDQVLYRITDDERDFCSSSSWRPQGG